jgi:hypothetical protein
MDVPTYPIRWCPFCRCVTALHRDAGEGKWKACDRCTASILAPLRASPTAPVCMHGRHSHEWCEPCECEV